MLGAIFVAIHFRSLQDSPVSHFEAIAHAYDAQIPEARRLALVARKSALMARVLKTHSSLR